MKLLKRIGKIILWLVVLLLILFTTIYFAVQNERVQNYLVDYTASWLSGQLKTKVTIGHVKIKFIKKVSFTDFYVEDLHHDTLLFAKELDVNIGLFSYKKEKLSISSIDLNHARVKLTKYPNTPGLNLDFIIDYFEGNDTTTTSGGGFDFKLESGLIKNTTFSYTNLNHHDTDMARMLNFNDLYITNLNAELYDFIFRKDSTYFFAKDMSFKEHCGLDVKKFSAYTAIDDTFMRFANLRLVTPESKLSGYLGFDYSYWDSFNYFNDSIKMLVSLEPKSVLSSNDVKYFADDLYGFNKTIDISGKIKGYVSRLKGRDLDIKYGKATLFKGNINARGLPDVEQAYFDIDIQDFKTNRSDVESIPLYPFSGKDFLKLPDNIESLNKLGFKGKFTGFYNDFVTYGTAVTDLGKINADVNIKNNESDESYSGNITVEDFDIGRLFGISNVVQKTSFSTSIKGTGFELQNAKATVNAEIKYAQVYGYNYQNLTVGGSISKRLFNGNVNINMPDIALDFSGNIDFTGALPLFNFTANVSHAKLAKLNFIDRDPSAELSTHCEMILMGSNLDNLKGSIKLQALNYSELENSFSMPELDFYSDEYPGGGKKFSIQSSLADISINGATQITNAIDAFRNLISVYLPVVKRSDVYNQKQNFSFNIKLNNTDEFFKIFVPSLNIAPATAISGTLTDSTGFFNLNIQSKRFKYDEIQANDLKVNSNIDSNLLFTALSTSSLIVNDSLLIEEFKVEGWSKQDSAKAMLEGGNRFDSLDTRFKLGLKAFFGENNVTRISVLPSSEVSVNDKIWQIFDNNAVVFENGKVRFENFKAYSDTSETIFLHGLIGNQRNEVIKAEFKNFDLILLKDLLRIYDIELGGKTTGSVEVASVLDNSLMSGNLFIQSFSFYGDTVGDATINSDYVRSDHKFVLDAFVERDGRKRITVNGEYLIGEKEDYMDFKIEVARQNVYTFQHYLKGLVHDLRGNISAELRLIGNPKEPELSGTGNIQQAKFIVDYLGTKYSMTNDFRIDADYFYFENAKIFDSKGHEALVNGNIYHDHLKKLDYDFKISAKNFEMLNTVAGENDLFYGNAFATGEITLKGNPDKTTMNMSLKSEKETAINIPLSTPEEVSEKSFIVFVNHDTTQKNTVVTKTVDTGFDLDIKLMVTPDAVTQLIFDQKIGDVIKGRGNGIIQMRITPDGDFKMYGDYNVQEGDYLFTMQNVLGKYFTLTKGGTIKWSGDPYDAHIDLSARYSRFAGLYDLFQDTSENYKKRVPVDVVLNLKNNLFNPDILFDIDVQNISAGDQAKVDRYLNDPEEKTRQVMSLLIFNRFTKPESFTGTEITSSPDAATGVNATLSEFISKQLSSWASQINRNFNIDFNYTPGDQLTQEQYDIAISTKLLQDRLSIYTSFGFGTEEQTQNAANVVGDFIVEYDITPDGRFKAKAFNKSNNNTIITNFKAPYTQGVGWAYRKEFNSFKELFSKQSKITSDTTTVKKKKP